RRELLVLGARDRFIEFPVEGLQRRVFRKLRGRDAARDPPVAPTRRLLTQQTIDRLQDRELLALGRADDVVQVLGRQRDPEDGEMLQDPLTQGLRLAVHRWTPAAPGSRWSSGAARGPRPPRRSDVRSPPLRAR